MAQLHVQYKTYHCNDIPRSTLEQSKCVRGFLRGVHSSAHNSSTGMAYPCILNTRVHVCTRVPYYTCTRVIYCNSMPYSNNIHTIHTYSNNIACGYRLRVGTPPHHHTTTPRIACDVVNKKKKQSLCALFVLITHNHELPV